MFLIGGLNWFLVVHFVSVAFVMDGILGTRRFSVFLM